MQQLLPVRVRAAGIKAAIAVFAVIVRHLQQAGLYHVLAKHVAQRGARRLRVLRQAALGEIELVGAVDQLDGAVEMALYIALDADADVACPQEGPVIAVLRHRSRLAGAAFLQHLVLRQAGERAIILAAQQRVVQQPGNDCLVGNLQPRHEMPRLVEIGGIVVDEQHALRPQLRRLDQGGNARPFRQPVDAWKDEIRPDARARQDVLHGLGVVLGTNRTHDAPPGEFDDTVVVGRVVAMSTLGDRAVPESLVQIPDHQPHRLVHGSTTPGNAAWRLRPAATAATAAIRSSDEMRNGAPGTFQPCRGEAKYA